VVLAEHEPVSREPDTEIEVLEEMLDARALYAKLKQLKQKWGR
jgi:hypothetical protein